MRRTAPLLALLALTAAVAGCDASGETVSARTFGHARVPFTFTVPTDFTTEPIDQGDTRGNVVAAAGLTKVDLIAVRRLGSVPVPSAPVRHDVQGHAVTSVVRRVYGGDWALECQYTAEREHTVRDACDRAVATVRRR